MIWIFVLFKAVITESLNISCVSILFTNDFHGYLAQFSNASHTPFGTFGSMVDFIKSFDRQNMSTKLRTIVLDGGDIIHGTPLSDVVNPRGSIPYLAFQSVDYDATTLGNHEVLDADIVSFLEKNMNTSFRNDLLATNVHQTVTLPDGKSTQKVFGTTRFKTIRASEDLTLFLMAFLLPHAPHGSSTLSIQNENELMEDVEVQTYLDLMNSSSSSALILLIHDFYSSPFAQKLVHFCRSRTGTKPIIVLGSHSHRLFARTSFPSVHTPFIPSPNHPIKPLERLLMYAHTRMPNTLFVEAGRFFEYFGYLHFCLRPGNDAMKHTEVKLVPTSHAHFSKFAKRYAKQWGDPNPLSSPFFDHNGVFQPIGRGFQLNSVLMNVSERINRFINSQFSPACHSPSRPAQTILSNVKPTAFPSLYAFVLTKAWPRLINSFTSCLCEDTPTPTPSFTQNRVFLINRRAFRLSLRGDPKTLSLHPQLTMKELTQCDCYDNNLVCFTDFPVGILRWILKVGKAKTKHFGSNPAQDPIDLEPSPQPDEYWRDYLSNSKCHDSMKSFDRFGLCSDRIGCRKQTVQQLWLNDSSVRDLFSAEILEKTVVLEPLISENAASSGAFEMCPTDDQSLPFIDELEKLWFYCSIDLDSFRGSTPDDPNMLVSLFTTSFLVKYIQKTLSLFGLADLVTINLCDYPQYITCPHKTGTMDFKESFEIPRIVPSGHYSASVDCFMGSETKKKALCYRLSMEFVNSTPFSRFIDSIFPE
ncbi:hypothetical protein BLNAU_12974 [Blattamonas nauphoetae]|uniref:MD-2-related lipid-recognition domain-containing protein n=1 Tax=Blattamonas nauphoetae TaxID=2049346 RepID=A0ABQ9XI58_9EUKA|nr:hypothetical protein BLNAU_12974 [Blattamonas nauphoetae]